MQREGITSWYLEKFIKNWLLSSEIEHQEVRDEVCELADAENIRDAGYLCGDTLTS